MKTNSKKVVVSGIRATGRLHLGNYLGAMKYFTELSQDNTKKCFFFIANLHTLTTKIDPDDIKRDLREIVLDFIAAGIDPEKSIIFSQSSVPETCELSWLLGCLTSIADLERMPHFKEKRGKKTALGEIINTGILTYPVLMAADILGPKANLVPVGEDQHPHIELARNTAQRFNTIYGDTFPIPDLLEQKAIRVPGLDGTGKMGKSDRNTIDLSDSENIVKSKIAKTVTDPSRKRRDDVGNPIVCTVYKLHTLISKDEEIKQVMNGCKSAKIGCVDCKNILSKNINEILAPIQERRAEFSTKGMDYILDILHNGGKTARKRILPTVEVVKDKMGVPFY